MLITYVFGITISSKLTLVLLWRSYASVSTYS